MGYGLLISRGQSKLSTYQIELSNFSLPTATDSKIGAIGTHYEQNDYNYPLSVDDEGRGFVYVPWTDYHVQSAWYEPKLSSIVFKISDRTENLSVCVSSLIDYYHADNTTTVLDASTKNFSIKTNGAYLTYDGYLVRSDGGEEGDVIYGDISTKASTKTQIMRFDLYPCENQSDITKTDATAKTGDIEIDLMNNIVYKFTSSGKVVQSCSDIILFCQAGRFMYNSITHKIFYNDGQSIYCCRKQKEDD